MKCTIEEFAERLKSRAVQFIVTEALGGYVSLIHDCILDDTGWTADLESKSGLDIATFALLADAFLAEVTNGKARDDRETVSLSLSNGINVRITGKPETVARIAPDLGRGLRHASVPAIALPAAEATEEAVPKTAPQPHAAEDPISQAFFAESPAPAMQDAVEDPGPQRPASASALNDSVQCEYCGVFFKMRGMPKHKNRCKQASLKPAPVRGKAKAGLREKDVRLILGAMDDNPAPPVPASSVGLVQCLECGDRFPNAKMLGAHRTQKHFGNESRMGSSLRGIA